MDEHWATDLRAAQARLQLQPILFIGSGFSLRYFNGPSWKELLAEIAAMIGITDPIEYLQTRHGSLTAVGSALIDPAFEWAWRDGAALFPDDFLKNARQKSDALKFIACEVIRGRWQKTTDPVLLDELASFAAIFPQGAITTNYDESLEDLLAGYHPIVGRDVYRYRIDSMGEIYKIHGTISDPASVVLTAEDYDQYSDRRRYISAKMIAMFAENPVIILGYSLQDDNVAKILCDVGEVIADDASFIDNIFFVHWLRAGVDATSIPATLPITSGGRTYHIRRLVVHDYKALFEVLGEPASLSNIQPQMLRAFMSRMNDVVRVDIPSRRVEVTYDHIERISNDRSAIPKLLGFSIRDSTNKDHPYTLGHIAEALDFRTPKGEPSSTQVRNKVIKVLKDKYGFDIQSGDNKYHEKIKTGKKETSFSRKYSSLFLDVAQAIKNGVPIIVDAENREITISPSERA